MDKVNSQMGPSMPPTGQRSGTETEIAVPGVQDSTDNVGLQGKKRRELVLAAAKPKHKQDDQTKSGSGRRSKEESFTAATRAHPA